MRFNSLTVLRGFLALLVVLCHGYERVGWLDGANTWDEIIFKKAGGFGVLCFFILSGFILSHVYFLRCWSLKNYIINRFARIYPLYLCCLLIVLPVDWISPTQDLEHRTEYLGYALTLFQSWFEFANARFNGPGWTLSVEFFFYSCFPVLLWASKKRSAIFYITFLASIALAWSFSGNSGYEGSNRFPPNRLWEFILGIICYQLFSSTKTAILSRRTWGLACLGAVGIGLFLIPLLEHYLWDEGFGAQCLQVICGAILILSLVEYEKKGAAHLLLHSPKLIYFGEISFALYLIHDGVQRYMKGGLEWLFRIPIEETAPLLGGAFVLGSLIISVIASMILYRLIEIPFRGKIRDYFKR